jgi:guanine deaminase
MILPARGKGSLQAFRGSILHFLDDPIRGEEPSYQYFDDGVLLLRDGFVEALGDAGPMQRVLQAAPVVDHVDAGAA